MKFKKKMTRKQTLKGLKLMQHYLNDPANDLDNSDIKKIMNCAKDYVQYYIDYTGKTKNFGMKAKRLFKEFDFMKKYFFDCGIDFDFLEYWTGCNPKTALKVAIKYLKKVPVEDLY